MKPKPHRQTLRPRKTLSDLTLQFNMAGALKGRPFLFGVKVWRLGFLPCLILLALKLS